MGGTNISNIAPITTTWLILIVIISWIWFQPPCQWVLPRELARVLFSSTWHQVSVTILSYCRGTSIRISAMPWIVLFTYWWRSLIRLHSILASLSRHWRKGKFVSVYHGVILRSRFFLGMHRCRISGIWWIGEILQMENSHQIFVVWSCMVVALLLVILLKLEKFSGFLISFWSSSSMIIPSISILFLRVFIFCHTSYGWFLYKFIIKNLLKGSSFFEREYILIQFLQ